MTIREASSEDRDAIRRVNELAFERRDEADLVDALRRAGGVTLSLVAVDEAEIVGHILFSPATITADDRSREAVGLAPMAVLPDHQRRGVGSRLVSAGLRVLKERGHRAVVVLGHEAFYPRFGFKPARVFGLRSKYDAGDAFMALELEAGVLSDLFGGLVSYHPAIDG